MDRETVYKLYGTREEFPLLHGLIDRMPEEGHRNVNILAEAEETKELEDDSYIAWAYYDPKKKSIIGKIVISLTKTTVWVDTRWDIESTNGEFVGAGNEVFYQENHIEYDICVPNIDIAIFSSKEFKVELITTWQFENQNYVHASRHIDSIKMEEITCVESIEVLDPIKKPDGPEMDNILIYYGRKPESTDKVDYDYSAQYKGDDEIHLFLDSAGNVTTNRKVAAIAANETVLKIDWGKGSRQYKNKKIYYTLTKEGFSWFFDPDWMVTLTKNFFFGTNVCDYILYIEFSCEGDNAPQHICVASNFDSGDLPKNCKRVPNLDLRLGCIGAGCRILCADGSLRKVEDIKIGDSVSTLGGSAKVTNVFQGPEDHLVYIQTLAGKEIRLSDAHPIFTDHGILRAAEINAGMKIQNGRGEYEGIYFLYQTQNTDLVYNLEVEKGAGEPSFICEGLVVGDVNTRTEVLDKKPEVDQSLRNELEKIKQKLREGKNECRTI